MTETPLGNAADYREHYSPDVLCAVQRADQRHTLGVDDPLPFHGLDLWNAWEITWLDGGGKPAVATGVFRVPAESRNLIESKSLKLYLNSLAMSRFDSADRVAQVIADDLSNTAAATVGVTLMPASVSTSGAVSRMPGTCIDGLDVDCDFRQVDPGLLRCTDGGRTVAEALHSHLLRSNCPVTGQPDMGSILVRYHGPAIDHRALLRYLVSFRRHREFHETCVERIFLDLKARCAPDRLTVYARYTRRGGLDINPFRSDFERDPDNPRLWRQ